MISDENLEIFKKSQKNQKFSKFFEDQLWEDLTFFVFNRFWISFFIDRSEIPWRTRFFDPKVLKKHRKKVARVPNTNRQISGPVSFSWSRPAPVRPLWGTSPTGRQANRAYTEIHDTQFSFIGFLS